MSDLSDARRLWTLAPALAAAHLQVSREFRIRFPGSTCTVGQAYRTPAMQLEAASNGRSPFDGSKSYSKHQAFPALALDEAVLGEDGKMVGDGTDARYLWLGERFEKLGFVWGGRWKRVDRDPDWDHYEIAGAQATADMAAAGLSAYQAVVARAPWLKL